MARRNRKKKKVNSFVFPVPFAGIVILLSSFALGYVWLGARCDALGKDLKGLEEEKLQLEKRLSNEEGRWAAMKAPREIEKALSKWGIQMAWPRRDQVVWLFDGDVYLDSVDRLARADHRHNRMGQGNGRPGRLQRTILNE